MSLSYIDEGEQEAEGTDWMGEDYARYRLQRAMVLLNNLPTSPYRRVRENVQRSIRGIENQSWDRAEKALREAMKDLAVGGGRGTRVVMDYLAAAMFCLGGAQAEYANGVVPDA